MVVAFSNLHIESGLKYVNDHISGKTCISKDQLTKNDIKVYGEILEQPCSDIYPNASKWYHAVSAKLVSSFPGKAFGVRFGSQTAPSMMPSVTLEKRQRKKRRQQKQGRLIRHLPRRKLFPVLRWKVFSGQHPNWS
ncbi:hypothetical protein P3S67_005392 [Capsicum chacoense]